MHNIINLTILVLLCLFIMINFFKKRKKYGLTLSIKCGIQIAIINEKVAQYLQY